MASAAIDASGGSVVTLAACRIADSSVLSSGGSRLVLQDASRIESAPIIDISGGGRLESDASSTLASCANLVLSGGSAAELYHCAALALRASGGSRLVCDADTTVAAAELSGGSKVERR